MTNSGLGISIALCLSIINNALLVPSAPCDFRRKIGVLIPKRIQLTKDIGLSSHLYSRGMILER